MLGSVRGALGSVRTAADRDDGGGGGGDSGIVTPSALFPLGVRGNTIVITGDSLPAGNAGDGRTSIIYPLLGTAGGRADPGGWLVHWHMRAGLPPPTVVSTATGGSTTANAVTNVNAWLIAPAADGADVIGNWGINDVIAGTAASVSAANVRTYLTAFFAARPNSRYHHISALWSGGELWGLSATGKPQGVNVRDVAIRETNAAIAEVIADFPNAHFYNVYDDVYAWSAVNNVPMPGAAGKLTSDGTHPGAMGARIVAGSIWRQMSVRMPALPNLVLPPARADFCDGDWYEQNRAWISLALPGTGAATVGSFNRWERVPMHNCFGPAVALPNGITDPGLVGGALAFAPGDANYHVWPVRIIPTPKTQAWVLIWQGKFTAQAAGRIAYFGLSTADPTVESLLVGSHQAVSANFNIRETLAGVSTNSQGGAPFAADANPHTFALFFDGGTIFNLYIDGRIVANLNPSGNFPTAPLALAAGLYANGGVTTVMRAMYAVNEANTWTGVAA